MPNVAWTTFVAALSVDTIGGSEKIPVEDAGTGKHITPDLQAAYTIDQLHGASVITALTDAHQLSVFTSADDEKIITFANVSAWVVDEIEALDVGGTIVAGDWLIYSDGGVLKRVLLSDVTTLINTSVLDLTALAAATPGDTDLFLFGSGATPKKITMANLETELWTDFATYLSTLAENTSIAVSDKFYCTVSGTPKWVDITEMDARFGSAAVGDVVGPGAVADNAIPQWSNANNTLKAGLTLVTTITAGGMADTEVPTAQAVDEFITAGGSIDINSITDLGEAIADVDLLLVDNGATSTNRKAAFSRVWTYITTKIQGLSAKTIPLGADILTIQDTAAASALKELTITNLALNLHPGLATTAGTGIDGIAESYVAGVEKIGTIFKTTIVIDLTGLRSTAAGDIIGDDGAATPCHLGQITAAVNGAIFAGTIACLEAPATGDPDIDLYSATESTGVEDSAISLLTETQLINAGDHVIDLFKSLTAFPAADEYLYLVAGDTTDADYTAGKLVITLWGK